MKNCQSCGMPLNLRGVNNRGSEKNGSESEKFCVNCYQDGKYTEPNITYDQMLAKGRDALKNKSEGSKIMRSLMSFAYPMQLKNLERWKK